MLNKLKIILTLLLTLAVLTPEVTNAANAYCWCKKPDGTCENHTVDASGNQFITQDQCNSYCSGRGWSAIHYDGFYHDRSATSECQPQSGSQSAGTSGSGSPSAPPPSGQTTAEQSAAAQTRFDQIRSDSKGLNQFQYTSAPEIIGLAVKILMSFMGAIMFILVVYAGLLWMTSAGNSDKIETAKRIIVWSTLGVTVMLASYIIMNFVFKQLLV